jgi:hypothetical protein
MARYLLKSVSTFDETFDSTFQDLVPRILGSRGGATFQRLGSTFAIRYRRVPIHHRSLEQTAARNRFESIQSRWRTLSGPDKGTWIMQAPNFPRTNSLGQPYEISGINLQQSSNSFLHYAGRPLLDEAQPPVAVPSFTIDNFVLVESIPALQLSIDPDEVPIGFTMMVYMTRYTSPGQLTPGQPFRFMGALSPGATPSLVNWIDPFVDFAGSPADKIGQQIFATVHFLSDVTGQPGVSVSGSGLVVI